MVFSPCKLVCAIEDSVFYKMAAAFGSKVNEGHIYQRRRSFTNDSVLTALTNEWRSVELVGKRVIHKISCG